MGSNGGEDQQDDYWRRRKRKEEALRLASAGDHEGVLALYDQDEGYREPLLVWVRPSRGLLDFLERELAALGARSVLSVGCGCAFLEWLLSRGTRLQVSGLEVNAGWWESRHSTPHLIPLRYTEPGAEITEMPGKGTALLFCYFNREPRWRREDGDVTAF